MFNFLKRKNNPPESTKYKAEEPPKSNGTNWQRSPAHLNLLSHFLKPRQAQATGKFQKWTEPLGEPVEVAIKRFLDLRMLQKADLANHLLAVYNSTELRGFLKERGLPQSGKKEIMAARLAEKDEQGAQRLVSGQFVLVCSEQGKILAEAYERFEEQRRKEALAETEKMLIEGQYRKAAITLANYEAKCVFKRGLNMEWDDYDPTQDETTLRYIFTRTPKILAKRGWDKFGNARPVAGMIHLWGNANLAGMSCDSETETAALALISHAHYLRQLDECRELNLKYVSVLTCNDDVVCASCHKAARKKKYHLDEVPEFPLEDCQEELGCRCSIAPTFD